MLTSEPVAARLRVPSHSGRSSHGCPRMSPPSLLRQAGQVPACAPPRALAPSPHRPSGSSITGPTPHRTDLAPTHRGGHSALAALERYSYGSRQISRVPWCDNISDRRTCHLASLRRLARRPVESILSPAQSPNSAQTQTPRRAPHGGSLACRVRISSQTARTGWGNGGTTNKVLSSNIFPFQSDTYIHIYIHIYI